MLIYGIGHLKILYFDLKSYNIHSYTDHQRQNMKININRGLIDNYHS